MNGPYENLANAVILQAVRDYRTALKALKMNPRSKIAQTEDKESPLSDSSGPGWYQALTSGRWQDADRKAE
jgi:hypothetical protein